MDQKRNKKLTDMFNEQSSICPYCHEGMCLDLGWDNTAELDHIIPKSKGGTDAKDNLIVVCHACNQEKGSDSLHEFFSKRISPIDGLGFGR